MTSFIINGFDGHISFNSEVILPIKSFDVNFAKLNGSPKLEFIHPLSLS